MDLSMELEEGEKVESDIGLELTNIVNSLRTGEIEIELISNKPCRELIHPLALRRIITNLLVNALRYGAHKPVAVDFECNKENIVIKIADRGQGIPPEHVKAVFRPFYRLEESRGSQTGGSCLGLAIVRQLADANKWSVELLPRQSGEKKAVLTIPRS